MSKNVVTVKVYGYFFSNRKVIEWRPRDESGMEILIGHFASNIDPQ